MGTEAKKRASGLEHIQIFFWDIIIFILSHLKSHRDLVRFIYLNKSKIIPFILFLMMGCMVTGLTHIPGFTDHLPAAFPAMTPKSGCTSSQCNFIVIHTDHLDTQDPQFISMWVLFINRSENPQMIWKKMIPAQGDDIDGLPFPSSQKLIHDGKLSRELVNYIKGMNFHWDGYIIMDHEAVDKMMYWSTGREGNFVIQEEQAQDLEPIYSEELRLANNYCNHLSAGNSIVTSDIDWGQLYPGHLTMNFDFDEFQSTWLLFSHIQSPVHCEVLIE